MLNYARAYRLSDETLGIVDDMLMSETPSAELEHNGQNGRRVPFDISGQEQSICEAVFRWQFGHLAPERQQRAQVYFLQIGGRYTLSESSEAFANRFADVNRPVRPVSASNSGMGDYAFDKKTAERGLIFRVTHFLWRADSELDVKGGVYETASSASSVTYSLKKENGVWKVTSEKTNWISKD